VHFRFDKMLNKQIGWAVGDCLYINGVDSVFRRTQILKLGILVIYFNSNPFLTPLQKRPFYLAKMTKIRDFNVDFLEIFWGHSPRPSQPQPPRGHPDCQVLRAPRYLNPALIIAPSAALGYADEHSRCT